MSEPSSVAATVADIAEEYWEAVLRAQPLFASMQGDHRYDDDLEDLTAEGDARYGDELRGFRDRAAAVDTGALDHQSRATQQLLLTDIDEQLRAIELRLVEMASDQMEGPHIGLLTVLPQLSCPTPESARMILERHRKVPGLFEAAADRYRAGLAAGRTPARLCIERSLNTLDSYLASPLDSDPFVTLSGPTDWDGEVEWRDALLEIARETVRPAFTRLRDVLADELLPVARPDDQCGLRWLDDGADIYANLVEHHTTLPDADPEAIHRLGLEQVDRLRDEYAAVGERAFGVSDQRAIFDRLLEDASLRYRSAEELLDDARAAVEAATAAAPSWFGRVPETPCDVTPVPDFLAADAPSAYYFPPPADRSRNGTYFVNLHEPQERTRFETAAVAFHEAVPGHHFQLALAVEFEDLPRFRRHSWAATAFVEGWALYAERLADEMGLYRDDLQRLGMLTGDSWRSCRLVVDTGMHALGWSRQQAIDYLRDNAPVPLVEVEVEIDRYVAMPAQALAYKVGQLDIERLRREASARLGTAFDARGFHDTVLGSATVTLPVLRALVDEWVRSR